MIVQWCCKGIAKLDEPGIRQILESGPGLLCRHWHSPPAGCPFVLEDALGRLTERNLDLHVNNYSHRDPATGLVFHDITPFISLAAGCVDRDALAKTNVTHRALRTALQFATTDYGRPGHPVCSGWVLICYVLVSTNRAVTIPAVAEEIRELNHNRGYSEWYWQGEVTAKINVPSNQILCALHWEPDAAGALRVTDVLLNLAFTHPSALRNERSML